MSADNWTQCDACIAIRDAELQNKKEKLNKKYGKIDMEEFLTQHSKLARNLVGELDNSLREDYEIGIRGGEFRISYSANCSVCGFSYTYQIRKDIFEKDESQKL